MTAARRELVIALLGSLALAVVAHWPVLGDSWPANHEYTAPFERTEHFRRAFAAGTLFPVWSTTGNAGHGGPMVLLYHRGFYAVAGLLAVPLGSHAGTVLALLLFTALAVFGVIRFALWLKAGLLAGFIGATLLISAQYFLIDWLVRSALAEACAMLLLPWVIFFGARFAAGERVVGRWAVSIAALFHAHLVVALFCLIPLFGFALVGVGKRLRERAFRTLFIDIGLGVAVLLVLVAPWVLAIQALMPLFKLDLTRQLYHPLRELHALAELVVPSDFKWGGQWQGYSVELGAWLVAAGALGVIAFLLKGRTLWRTGGVLVLALAWGVFLQSQQSRPFYERFEWAGFLQFPWRMNALVSVVLVLLFIVGVAAVQTNTWLHRGVLVVGAVLLVPSLYRLQQTQRLTYEWMPVAQLAERIANPDGGGAGEYVPRWVQGAAPGVFLRTSGCTATPTERPAFFTTLTVHIEATAECVVEIGQYTSPLIEVTGADKLGVSQLGDLQVLVGAGTRDVKLRVRSFWEVVSWYFHPPQVGPAQQ